MHLITSEYGLPQSYTYTPFHNHCKNSNKMSLSGGIQKSTKKVAKLTCYPFCQIDKKLNDTSHLTNLILLK